LPSFKNFGERQFEILRARSLGVVAGNSTGSLDELVAKHGKAAFGGLARRLILDHIPVLGVIFALRYFLGVRFLTPGAQVLEASRGPSSNASEDGISERRES
jgi:hypothetical protein